MRPVRRPARPSLLILGVLLPSPLVAQTGPVGASAQVTPSFGAPPARRTALAANARLRYDSNVLRGYDAAFAGAARARGSDQIFSPSAEFDVARPVGRQSVFATGSIGYDFYRRNTRLNRERILVATGADLTGFAGCAGGVNASYARRQTEFDNLVDPINGQISAINVETLVNYGANVSCGRSQGLRPTFSYMRNIATNNTALRNRYNVRGHTYRAGLSYSRPSLGTLSLYGSRYDGSYPNRQGIIGGQLVTDGIQVDTLGMSFSRQIGTRLRGEVAVGYTEVKPRISTVRDFKGVSYSGQINYRAADRLTATLVLSREPRQSNTLNVAYSVVDTVALEGIYAFSPRISALAGASYVKQNFRDTPLLPASVLRGDTQTSFIHGGVRYMVGRRLGFTLDGSYRKRTGSGALPDFSSKVVTFTTSYQF